MKSISTFFEKETLVIRNYIVNYINNNTESLSPQDGFNLGVFYSNFIDYVILCKLNKISSLEKEDQLRLDEYEEVLKNYPGLIDYIIDSYQRHIGEMKFEDLELYNVYMTQLIESRGFSIN